jgi:ABC-2 type transport system permease protein
VIRHALRAYPTLLRVGFSEMVAYRAEFLVWILTTNMPLVMLALWTAVAADGPVRGFDQGMFATYMLSVLIVRILTSSWMVWELTMDIRQGKLATRLLRPLHPLLAYSAQHLAAVPLRAVVVSPLVLILVATTGVRLGLRDPATFGLFVASLAGAWLLFFFTMVLIGSLAMFVDSALSLFELWLGVHFILSGYLFPLEVLPAWAVRLAHALPFRYMLGFPAELLAGRLDHRAALGALGIQWAYVTVAFVAAITVWRAGMRRFVAFGG